MVSCAVPDRAPTLKPTECQRCVAEERAAWWRSAMSIGSVAVIFLAAVPCCFSCLMFRYIEGRGASDASALLLRSAEGSVWLIPFALVVACAVLGLGIPVRYLTRRASTPLSPPAADPTAHYREGAAPECPRHPFAR